MHHRRSDGRHHSCIWIENDITWIGAAQNEPFHEFYRKLARMDCLLDVVSLDIGKDPDVTWVFPQRITAVLTSPWSFVVALSWIFLRHSDRIEIKCVAIAFSEPENGFVTTRESLATVETVFKVPHDSIAELKAVPLKVSVHDYVEREDFLSLLTSGYVIPHLPTD